MKKALVICMLVAALAGCSSKPAAKTAKYESAKDEKGSYNIVDITITDDKITALSIDTYYAPKSAFKKALKDDYGMKAASAIKKEWYEQMEAFEKWAIGKSVDEVKNMKVKTKEDGGVVADEPDLVASCTMKVDGYIKDVVAAAEQAK